LQIYLDDIKFDIIHRTNKRIKRVSLSLENKDEIIVKTPLRFKTHQLRDIVLTHKIWILNSIKKIPAKNSFEFITGKKLPFLGKMLDICMIEDLKIINPKIKLQNDTFYIYYNMQKSSYEDFKLALEKFYKQNAINIIDPLFDKYTFITQLYPNKISYRKAKKRWGSCSYKNDISINYMILQFSIEAIEYVILHELCHIKEKNHSKRFWNLVSSYMPNYKKIQELLKYRFV